MKQNSKIENYSSFSNLMVLDRMVYCLVVTLRILIVQLVQSNPVKRNYYYFLPRIKNESRDNVEDDLVVYKDQIISDSER